MTCATAIWTVLPASIRGLWGCALTVLLLASFPVSADSENQGVEHSVHWGYETDNGPDDWGAMDPGWRLCASGREQSPIDLTRALKIDRPAGVIDTPSGALVELLNQAGVIRELDNGHTIQALGDRQVYLDEHPDVTIR